MSDWRREMQREAAHYAFPGLQHLADDVTVTIGVDMHHCEGERPFPTISVTLNAPGAVPVVATLTDRAARAFWLRLIGGPIRDLYAVKGQTCWWCGLEARAEYDPRTEDQPNPTWPTTADHVHEAAPPSPQQLLVRAAAASAR